MPSENIKKRAPVVRRDFEKLTLKILFERPPVWACAVLHTPRGKPIHFVRAHNAHEVPEIRPSVSRPILSPRPVLFVFPSRGACSKASVCLVVCNGFIEYFTDEYHELINVLDVSRKRRSGDDNSHWRWFINSLKVILGSEAGQTYWI